MVNGEVGAAVKLGRPGRYPEPPSSDLVLALCVEFCFHGRFPFCYVTRNLAADLLQMIPDNELQLVKLCAFYPGCEEEMSDLREKVVGDAAPVQGLRYKQRNKDMVSPGPLYIYNKDDPKK